MKTGTVAGHVMSAGTRFPIVLAVVLFLALAAPSAVPAEDYQFKFQVPVQVKNLHPYAQSVEALCGLKDANGNFITFDVAHSPYDKGTLDADGSFSGTLSHSVKMFNPTDATKAKTYRCSLRIYSKGMSHVPEFCPDPMSIYYCLKPGTSSNLTVEGPIP